MITKETDVLIVFIIFVVPSLFGAVIFIFNASHNTSTENTEQAVKLIGDAAVPWWIGPLQWLSGVPILGGLFVLGFIFFLNWSGTTDM